MRGVRWGRRALGAIAVLAMAWAAPAAGAGGTRGGEDAAWAQRALGLQYELGSDLGFRDAPWIGTHNSFNSTAEMGPTLSAQDSNQRITIIEQLDEGMRTLELDLHYFASLSGGGFEVVVCHGRDRAEFHAGCTAEKTLAQVLGEIATWLRAHPDQVLLLYLEDDMDEEAGYAAAGEDVETTMGDLVHRPQPSADGCQELPLDLSRDDVRAAGKQVVIVTDCGGAASWRGTVFTWKEHAESQPEGFTDFPDCGNEFTPEEYATTLVRYYEDSTSLSAAAGAAKDPITEDTTAQMARCGVDKIDFDQLAIDDPRVAASIWSWAPGEPGKGSCSVQRIGGSVQFGRWRSRPCDGGRRVACRARDGTWRVTGERMEFDDAKRACRKESARFAVPRTGYEAQLLRLATEAAGARGAWLGQKRAGAAWEPLDRR